MPAMRDLIVQQLPYLRRYVRSLTGSQQVGDEYIRGCLETLLQEPERIGGEGDLRVQLYKLFHSYAGTVETATQETVQVADPVVRRVGERLIALAPRDRQALLLVHQEGFAPAQVADILGMTEDEAVTRIEQAWGSLKRQPTTNILIIEDEPIIALEISEIVRGLGHRVCGTAATAAKAIALAKKAGPGLILADIQLQDGSSGIEAVREILKAVEVPVIFVTAYPERLLTGEALEPAFVITKPFNPATVKVAVSQALFLTGEEAESAVA